MTPLFYLICVILVVLITPVKKTKTHLEGKIKLSTEINIKYLMWH